MLAMAQASESGGPSALMVPTEILATTIAPIAKKAGLKVLLLTGGIKGNERDSVLDRLNKGQTHIIIGTHTLSYSKGY